jgi:hypothetical protein
MLVEVDGSSMHDLFWDYHKLIVRVGADLPPAETVCYFPSQAVSVTDHKTD